MPVEDTVPPDEILRVENLSKYVRKYDSKGSLVEEAPLFLKLNFQIEKGETFTIVGPSGVGKSTLLRLINLLEDYDQGEIYFKGKPISSYSPITLRRMIGFVTQLPSLFEGDVLYNFRMAERFSGRGGTDDYRRLLQAVDLPEDLLTRSVSELSVGQQQRVNIARALLSEPELLLLDEPTSALDPTSANKILSLLAKMKLQFNTTLVFVTHSMEQALHFSDRILLILPQSRYFHLSKNDLQNNQFPAEVERFIKGELK